MTFGLDQRSTRSPQGQSHAVAAVSGGAVSRSVPRLADFATANKSALVSPNVLRGFVRMSEGLLVATIGTLIAALYVSEPQVLSNPQYWGVHVAAGIFAVITLELLGLYRMPALSAALANLPRIGLGWAVTMTVVVATMFFLKAGGDYSRVWIAGWFIVGAAALAAHRLVVASAIAHLAHQGRLYRRVAIYGSEDVARDVIAALEADTTTDIRICGLFDDRVEPRSGGLVVGYPRLGGLKELLAFSRSTRVDVVIVALPMTAERRLDDAIKCLSVLPAEIKMPALSSRLRFTPRTYSHVGAVAMIDLHDKPIADWGTVSKWVFDKAVGLVALILLAPVMLAIAAAVKFDSKGPVLFRQKRYGFNNELIEVFKFRSMYVDQADQNAAKLVTRDDPRVTRVGRFIRKTSLDELPQLLNVLKGDLSLVGPRPHALQAKAADKLYDEVVDNYFARHKVKPGITGWAQINGWRGETDTAEKIEMRIAHDLYYIENWSVFLDAYILMMTPFSLITRTEGAY